MRPIMVPCVYDMATTVPIETHLCEFDAGCSTPCKSKFCKKHVPRRPYTLSSNPCSHPGCKARARDKVCHRHTPAAIEGRRLYARRQYAALRAMQKAPQPTPSPSPEYLEALDNILDPDSDPDEAISMDELIASLRDVEGGDLIVDLLKQPPSKKASRR